MPIPTFTKMGPNPSFTDVINKINTLVGELTNLMLNLDSLNVVEINAGTLVIYDLDGGPGTITINKDGMVINNGSFDTFKVDADGNVTMTSALIRSATGYPYVEMNPTGNLFGAFLNATRSLTVRPSESDTASPTIRFTASGQNSSIYQNSFDLTLSSSAAIRLSTSNVIYLGDLTTDFVTVYNWATLLNAATGRTLQQDLDSKATKSVATSSAGAATLNGGIPIGTQLMVNGGGTVTWTGISVPAHTHTQN